MFDSLNGLYLNFTNISKSENTLDNYYMYFESTSLYISDILSNQGANAFGNCTLSYVDIIEKFNKYIDMYSLFLVNNSVGQFIESFILTLMSKVIQFRSDLYYLDYYSKNENVPGMI